MSSYEPCERERCRLRSRPIGLEFIPGYLPMADTPLEKTTRLDAGCGRAVSQVIRSSSASPRRFLPAGEHPWRATPPTG